MKKLINNPADYVAMALEGFASAYPDKVVVEDMVVFRAEPKDKNRVALISGGGAGHEPLHAGFVGFGMLDAAVVGPVFTSPTSEQILQATRKVAGNVGVLYIVKNYTGDVLNFDLAQELSAEEGYEIQTVIVNDDVGAVASLKETDRRGVAGTLFVEKIAGAAAERGDSLNSVATIAQKVIDNVRSMGVALSSVTIPHVGKPSFDLNETEIEIGIGIHGEPGRYRGKIVAADTIVDSLISPIAEDLGLEKSDRVIVLINGMGGTPASELYIVNRRVNRVLEERGIEIARTLVGSYVTSLNMQGCSISLLRVDQELLDLYDAAVNTPTLQKGI